MDRASLIERFNSLPMEIGLEFSSRNFLNKLKEIEDKYNLDLSDAILLVAVNDLDTLDIYNYLVEIEGLNDDMAETIGQDINNNLLNPLFEHLALLYPGETEEILPIKRVKEIICSIFSSSLIEEINNHPVIIEAFNRRILDIFSSELKYSAEFEKSLSSNEEKIASKPFILNGRNVQPTIANWLALFVQENGSSLATTLKLSQFVSSSKFTNGLTAEEKDLLMKVLKTYNNIKFFPDSMPTDHGDGWEIIPYDHEEVNSLMHGTRDRVFEELNEPNKSGDKKEISSIDVELQKTEEVQIATPPRPIGHPSSERRGLNPDQEKRQAELMALAATYPVGSLERRAVEEELKRVG